MEPIEIKENEKTVINKFLEKVEGSTPEPDQQIESLLEPVEANYKNLNKFIKNCNRSNTVSFIGAGTSKPLGITDWEGLIEELIKYTNYKHSYEISKKDTLTFPEIAEKIYKYLESKNDHMAFFDIIIKNMRPPIATTSLTLIKLILFLNIHLTTNFDGSIEYAYRFLDYLSECFKEEKIKKEIVTYVIPDFGNYDAVDNQGFLYYLHGNIDKKIFIFKKFDYDTYYPSISNIKNSSDCIEVCLKRFFIEKSILFIGFSLSDTYLRDFLFKLAKDKAKDNEISSRFYRQSRQAYNPREPSHFLLIDSDNKTWLETKKKEDFFEELGEFFIYPIVYKANQHIFIEYLFELMSKKGA